ncbi:MAG: DUF4149 domain-containing protein [Candidatus Acidiferrales bacterium]
MRSALRLLQFFALGTWVGAILYFSAIVAPGAFRTMANPDQAGDLVAFLIGRLHVAGIVLGVIYLLATMLVAKSARALGSGASICVMLMVILTAISQYMVVARMEALSLTMGSVWATPPEMPIRVAFEHLHDVSVWMEVVILVAGVAALYLTARDASAPVRAENRA